MGEQNERVLEAIEFSREFERLAAPNKIFIGSKVLNFLENSAALGILFAGRDVVMVNFERMKRQK